MQYQFQYQSDQCYKRWLYLSLLGNVLSVIRSRQPEAVTMISASFTASIIFFTSNPSIAACNAQIGSISVTITRAPAPCKNCSRTFTHITVTTNNSYFTSHHYISCSTDRIYQTFFTTIFVIKFRFGNRIIHVDCRNWQSTFFHSFI